MRKIIMILLGLVLCMSVVGCSDESTTEAVLKIDKSGQVTGVLVEEFEQDYYDLGELEDMIRLEISTYNQENAEERIVLVSIEAIEGFAKAIIQYKDYEDYAQFSGTEFFVGTVEEAIAEGINLNHVMLEAGKDSTISPQQVRELTDYKLVMWQGDMPVEVPGKIMYHTGELTLLGSKKIIAEPDLSGPFYLIYK